MSPVSPELATARQGAPLVLRFLSYITSTTFIESLRCDSFPAKSAYRAQRRLEELKIALNGTWRSGLARNGSLNTAIRYSETLKALMDDFRGMNEKQRGTFPESLLLPEALLNALIAIKK